VGVHNLSRDARADELVVLLLESPSADFVDMLHHGVLSDALGRIVEEQPGIVGVLHLALPVRLLTFPASILVEPVCILAVDSPLLLRALVLVLLDLPRDRAIDVSQAINDLFLALVVLRLFLLVFVLLSGFVGR